MNQAFSESAVMAGRNLCNKLWNISRFVEQVVSEDSSSSEPVSLSSSKDSDPAQPEDAPQKTKSYNREHGGGLDLSGVDGV